MKINTIISGILISLLTTQSIMPATAQSKADVKKIDSYFKRLRRGAHCYIKGIPCGPEDEKAVSQAIDALLIILGTGVSLGIAYYTYTTIKREKHQRKNPLPSFVNPQEPKQIEAAFRLSLVTGNVPAASEILNQYKFDKDSLGMSLLALAPNRMLSSEKTSKVVSFLIENGAPVNWQDPDNKMTPLMMAADKGNLPFVQELLKSKADTTITDKNGKTAYNYAAEKRYPVREIIEALLGHTLPKPEDVD